MSDVSLSIPVPVPSDAPPHFSTSTRLAGAGTVVTSWVERRASVRVGMLDLITGDWSVLRGVRGMVRAALPLAPAEALILTDHGLYAIDIAHASVLASVTKGIGSHNDTLRFDTDGHVVVGHSERPTEFLVATDGLVVAKRRRRAPIPRPVIEEDAAAAGVVRMLIADAPLRVGATGHRPNEPQCVVVLTETGERVASLEMPHGVADALLWRDGLLLAPPDVGATRELRAVAGLATTGGEGDLVRLADRAAASAEKLLSARRTPPRSVVRGIRVAEGSQVSDVRAHRLMLEDCRIAQAESPERAPRITRLAASDIEVRSASINGAVLEDVTIDGLRCSVDDGFVFGCELRRVTLRGRIEHLVLNDTLHHPDTTVAARYEARRQQRLADPEWMLDLREATGDITVRGYPSRFLRLDPERHAVVSAAHAEAGAWRSIDAGGSSFAVELENAVLFGWEDVTLIIDPKARHAEADRRYISELRRLGIAR
jgi:hypothetical protein